MLSFVLHSVSTFWDTGRPYHVYAITSRFCYIEHVNGKLSKHFNWQMADKLSCYHLLRSIVNSKKLAPALTHTPILLIFNQNFEPKHFFYYLENLMR